MSDMNVAARAMDNSTDSLPAVSAQVVAEPVVWNCEPGPSSDFSISITNPWTGVTFCGKLAPVPPGSDNDVKADSSTTPVSVNVPNFKPSVSLPRISAVIPDVKPNEHPVAMPDHSEDQPFVAAATQSEG